MGWDVTYHPFSPEEVKSIYFQGVENSEHYKTLSKAFDLDENYAEVLRLYLEHAATFDATDSFETSHGFYMAIVAGILRKYWYLRGGAFSFLLDYPEFHKYITDWRELVPENMKGMHFRNRIAHNFSGGVFLSHASLLELKLDYEKNLIVKAHVDERFSHGRLAVFWKAVDFSIENNFGLIEATDLIIPNPFDLNSTICKSRLHNCDIEGAYLYAAAAIEQYHEITSKDKGNNEPDPAVIR
jgi:hypothetical protein